MPAEYKPMTEQSFNKHKTLIYITLTPLMALFSYLANYAMVFRITASVVSYLSVFGTTGWILYQILNKSTTKKTHGLFLIFISLYTLNKFFILAILTLSFLIRYEPRNKKPNETNVDARIHMLLPEIILTGVSFLFMDIAREYSVWQEWVFRPQPIIGFAICGVICLRYMRKKSDHSS